MKYLVAITFLLTFLVACGGGEPAPSPVAQTTPPATLTTLPPAATEPPTPTLPPNATAAPSATVAVAPATQPPAPTVAPPTAAPPTAPVGFPDFLANPPAREPSPGRVTNGKTYPPGAYEFIHDQFDIPAPPGRVPDAFVAALPGVAPGQCPLTGEAAPAGAEARRPINVRLDNSPQGRPQAGLDTADVVWEALAEGGVTRLTATFHCRTPGTVGPIRSARFMDLQLTPMLGAWLVHVGASQPMTDMIWASPYADRDIDEWSGDPAFYRIDNAPVNWLLTYSNNQLLQSLIAASGDATLPAPLRGWTFSDAAPGGATGAATRLYVPFQGGSSSANWAYDPASGRYFRYQGDAAHRAQSGSQVTAANLVVLFSPMTVTSIVEDSLGSRSLHFDLQGEGRALLLRDGQLWETRWLREGENTLIRVVDANGQPIPLAPGQTWVHIVEEGMGVTWE